MTDSSSAANPAKSREPLVILYGSQTGISESIAKGLQKQALEAGFNSTCTFMDNYAQTTFPGCKVAIFICSSTGDGDVPDNAIKFLRFLRQKTHPFALLEHLNFAFLALGDTNYSTFCGGGKKVYQKLLDLGAKEFYPKGMADDGTSLDKVVEPWIEGLWEPLENICLQYGANTTPTSIDSIDSISKTLQETMITSDSNQKKKSSESESLGNGTKHLNNDNHENKQVPEKTLLHSTLIINQPGTQDLLKGIPKLAESSFKIILTDEKRPKTDAIQNIFVNNFSNSQPISVGNPFPSKFLAAQCLTSPDAVKKTLFIELEISGSGMTYSPGAAFGIICPNEEEMVVNLAKRLNLDLEDVILIESVNPNEELPPTFRKKASIFECLSYFVNLRNIAKKSFYRAMAEYCKDQKEKYYLMYICSKAGMNEFQHLRNQDPSVLELLETFPSCSIPLNLILDNCYQLQPRYYSVVNSPLVNPNLATFAFNIIHYSTPEPYNQPRDGLCTNYLHKLVAPIERDQGRVFLFNLPIVPIFLKPSNDFTLPGDSSIPLIMIGPGTGVAPFIGFLQHRENLKRANPDQIFGETWLFFGCRHHEKDYVFNNLLENFKSDGVLNHLIVSFSREETSTPTNKYVHHQLRIHGEEIYNLIFSKNAMIFVCGDSTRMALDVNEALEEIITKHHHIDLQEAKKLIIEWGVQKRIIRDVWA